MKHTFTKLLFSVGVLLLAFKGGAQIINGTMDVNTPGWPTCNSVYGWNTSNDIQWEYQWNVGGTGWWADLTGCGWGNGHWMEQTVATIPGHTYYLSFQLGCWNGQCFTDAGADLYIDGGYINHYAHTNFSGSQLAWATFDYCFVAVNTSTTIRFVGNGAATYATPAWANPINNFVGVIGLDNVSLTDVSAGIIATSLCAPATLTSSLPGNVVWYYNGTYISSAGSIVASTPGTYTLISYTPCGVFTDEVEIIECDPCDLTADFGIFNDKGEAVQTLCVGEPYTLSGNSNMGTNVTYSWDFGDGTSAGPSSNPDETHTYLSPGTYVACLTVTIQAGPNVPEECIGKTFQICKTLNVVNCGDPDPCSLLLNFLILDLHEKEPEVICAGQKYIFRGISTVGAPLADLVWDFGDGTIVGPTANPNTVHAFPNPGTYIVCPTARILPGPGVPKECEGRIIRICKTIIVKNCKNEDPAAIGANTSPTMQLEYPALDIFPNPASDELSITGLMEEKTETVLELYDISGQLVMTQIVEPGKREAKLHLKELKAGVYLLKLQGQEYRQEVKVVKQ